MQIAIKEARKARLRGDYAIGASISRGGRLVASGGNRVITKNDSTRHIELEILQYVIGMTDKRYIDDCILWTTAETCLMCLGACYWAGIKKVYYGISQEDITEYGIKYGTTTHKYRPSPILTSQLLDTFKFPVKTQQFMRKECLDLLYEN